MNNCRCFYRQPRCFNLCSQIPAGLIGRHQLGHELLTVSHGDDVTGHVAQNSLEVVVSNRRRSATGQFLSGGRMFFTAGNDLDRYVVWDYVNRRREILG